MKKTTRPAKLRLQHETLKNLAPGALKQVIGGATHNGCAEPTTTVQPTGVC